MESAPTEEGDIALCAPNFLVKAAGALLGVTGLLLVTLALQTGGVVRLAGVVAVAVAGMAAAGVASMFLATRVVRHLGWASIAATTVSGVVVLTSAVWSVFAVAHGLFSLLSFVVPTAALAALVLSALSIPSAQRADAARARLAERGVDMAW